MVPSPLQTDEAYLNEVSDQGGREHVVDPVVFVTEHVVEVATAAVGRQDEHVASVDARTEKGNQVLMANLAHLQMKCSIHKCAQFKVPMYA